MKKIIALALVGLSAITLTGCGTLTQADFDKALEKFQEKTFYTSIDEEKFFSGDEVYHHRVNTTLRDGNLFYKSDFNYATEVYKETYYDFDNNFKIVKEAGSDIFVKQDLKYSETFEWADRAARWTYDTDQLDSWFFDMSDKTKIKTSYKFNTTDGSVLTGNLKLSSNGEMKIHQQKVNNDSEWKNIYSQEVKFVKPTITLPIV